MGFGFVMTKILFAQNSWNKVKTSSKIRKLEKFDIYFHEFFWLLLPKFKIWDGDWPLGCVSY